MTANPFTNQETSARLSKLQFVLCVSLDHPQRPPQVNPDDRLLYPAPTGPRRCTVCGRFIGNGTCPSWRLVGGLEKEWDHW